MSRVKVALKQLRASQPFNFLASSTIHMVAGAARVQPEFIIKHLPRVGHVKSKLPNGRMLRLWSRGDDWVSNQVFWREWDGYEPEASALFFRLAQRSTVTMDVGAHVGFYALLAGHANPGGRVYAFEPLQATFTRLEQNVKLNGLSNVTCINKALAATNGTVEFFIPEAEIPCSAGMSSDFYAPWADAMSSISVHAVSGDSFVRDNGIERVDLLKIDTESTEPEVLLGMTETLKRDHPIILCEVLKGCGSEKALENILSALGYRFYLLTPNGPVPCAHTEGHPEWLNYLFAVDGNILAELGVHADSDFEVTGAANQLSPPSQAGADSKQ